MFWAISVLLNSHLIVLKVSNDINMVDPASSCNLMYVKCEAADFRRSRINCRTFDRTGKTELYKFVYNNAFDSKSFTCQHHAPGLVSLELFPLHLCSLTSLYKLYVVEILIHKGLSNYILSHFVTLLPTFPRCAIQSECVPRASGLTSMTGKKEWSVANAGNEIHLAVIEKIDPEGLLVTTRHMMGK